jgi:hypothetical protein
MDQSEKDRQAFELACSYLLGFGAEGVTPELLDKYGRLSVFHGRPDSLNGIYERMLESLQNRGMRSKVIGGSIGGVHELGKVLVDFQPSEVVKKYADGSETLLRDIVNQLHPIGQIRGGIRSVWPQFCRGCLSGAKFLAQFSSHDDFYAWVDFFDGDERARLALPLLLSVEIQGFGFALACDFLKELGFTNFGKPDVHLRDIFSGIGLCPQGSSDYALFTAISRVSANVGRTEVTPYYVDKIFWLIGSGNFYDDPLVGNHGRVATNKWEFIDSAKHQLGSVTTSGDEFEPTI